MSFISQNELFLSFKEFFNQQQVFGTAIGFLLAQTTLELAKSGVQDLITPLVTAIMTRSVPRYQFKSIGESWLTFFITLIVIFSIVKLFDLQTQAVPIVATVSNARL
jgi:large-conductance mechanosensitive channel